MKFTELTPFELTWSFSPGSTPTAGFSSIALVNQYTFNRDVVIHSIIGSGFIEAASVGAFPYGAYVLIDRNQPLASVLNANNPITNIIFGLTVLANNSSGVLKEDMNGQVNYRQPIHIPSGKTIAAYVMRNNNVIGSGRGLFTLLTEVL